MNTVASAEQTTTTTITTTLFDLMIAMQQNATTPLHEVLIVPTVVDLLHAGRIKFEGGLNLQLVA